MLKQLKSEQGSVLMEFCLMLPIWLLLFGGTFLIFDVSMGKLHLQESNRNLAWIQNDRFDKGNKINKELYKRVTRYYDARNNLEVGMSGEPIWSFSSGGAAPKQDKDNPQQWGSTNQDFSGNGVELSTGNSWANGIPGLSSVVSGTLGSDWAMLCSGNMELKMERVSATYIGAIGVSSVLFPADDENGEETVPLYKSAFTFTRSVSSSTDKDGKVQQSAKLPNGEMLVLRRSGQDERGDIKDVNGLLFDRTIYRAWPSNGSLGDIRLFLGI